MKLRCHGALIGVCDNGIGMLPAFGPNIVAAERRLKIRYPIRLSVCYRTIGRSLPVSGNGYTLNMSSSGLLFTCDRALAAGTRIAITMEWPWLLEPGIPLQLVTVGRIVRWEDSNCGINFSQYQFKTMKRRQVSIPRAPDAHTTFSVLGA